MPPYPSQDLHVIDYPRYYRPWLETFISTELEPIAALPPPPEKSDGHRPRSSKDKALTAFTQLGCLRLDVKRSVVTLLASSRQYIIAEATKTLSLLNDAHHGQGDELWFGNAFIDSKGGVSVDAIHPENYTARDPDGTEFTTPALVVNDISKHEKYKSRGYAGQGVSFYCGVPITTANGHVIGVYTVTDDKPRNGISATELQFLVDMAVIVMQHLETVRNDRTRKRGERLIDGLGRFIEGDMSEDVVGSSSNSGSTAKPESTAESKAEKTGVSPDQAKPPSSTQTPGFLGMVINDANSSAETSKRLQVSSSSRPGSLKKSSSTEQSVVLNHASPAKSATAKSTRARDRAIRESQHVFDHAAAILRGCLGSDGVVFFNASSANLSSGSRMQAPAAVSASVSRMHHSRGHEKRRSDQQSEPSGNAIQETRPAADHSISSDESGSTRSQSDSSSSQIVRSQKSQILGLSVLDGHKAVTIPEQALRRLVRRHPKGKCFTFDQFGKPASSDESSESVSANDGLQDNLKLDDPSKLARRFPATSALAKAFPGARNVVFLPLWDVGKERWHSGLIVWSNDPGNLTNVEDNMLYLKAFSNAVMNEVNRIDLALSDTAKSTFLANISHELRSPLHGILGSIEFLHDTAMDDFQSSMVISVETCGKTLLDTVNHVLDYAKIHNLSRAHRLGKNNVQDGEQPSKPETSLTEDFDMAIVVEEAVEAVYAGQVFRTANADQLETKTPVQTAASRAMQQRQERRANISKASAAQKSPVRLTLNIDDNINWRVTSQPGAIRRIVMNILGNALKYTGEGSINVSLEVDRSRSKTSSNLHILLNICDTGFGMSDDFVKNHAFTAFSQENTLATGTGLGLSIVRQIVDSLGGKIDLASEKDVGTDVRIWLSLPKSQQESSPDFDSNAIPEMRERTQGNEMCMLLPGGEEKRYNTVLRSLVPMPTVESSMRNLVAQWFRMKVTTTKTMEGRSPDFFIYPEPPPIDYLMDFHGNLDSEKVIPVIILCTNAFEAASLRSNGIHHLTDIGKVIEVIPQPCGPQKLAKVLHRCLRRMEMLKSEQPKKKSSNNVALSFGRHNPGQQDERNGEYPHEAYDANSTQDAAQSPRELRGPTSLNENISSSKVPNSTSDTPSKPQLQPRKASVTNENTPEESGTLNHTDNDVSRRPPVLVVDDNQINLHLLVTWIRKSGHPYDSAADGLKAVEAYKRSLEEENGQRAFKYILMDISMPVMDGVSATKEIRKIERDKGVKPPARIIALTGMGSDIAEKEASDAGFDQFLSKPVKFRDLVKLLV